MEYSEYIVNKEVKTMKKLAGILLGAALVFTLSSSVTANSEACAGCKAPKPHPDCVCLNGGPQWACPW
jgi:hypothetical protein